MLRVALAGYGQTGTRYARALETCHEAELVAIAVIGAKQQQEAREAHPAVEVIGDAAQLAARSDIDAVCIVAPVPLRFALARAALQSGKHVLVQPPVALRNEECDTLVQLASDQRCVFAALHPLRFSPLWSELKQLNGSGVTGRVQHVRIELARPAYRQGTPGWRADSQPADSWLTDEPVHYFDLARWYLQPSELPEAIYARANVRRSSLPGLHDNFTATIGYPDQTFALITQSLGFGQQQLVKIVGDQGIIEATRDVAPGSASRTEIRLRYGRDGDVHEVNYIEQSDEDVKALHVLVTSFAAAAGGEHDALAATDPCDSTRLVLAAQGVL